MTFRDASKVVHHWLASSPLSAAGASTVPWFQATNGEMRNSQQPVRDNLSSRERPRLLPIVSPHDFSLHREVVASLK